MFAHSDALMWIAIIWLAVLLALGLRRWYEHVSLQRRCPAGKTVIVTRLSAQADHSLTGEVPTLSKPTSTRWLGVIHRTKLRRQMPTRSGVVGCAILALSLAFCPPDPTTPLPTLESSSRSHHA